MLTQHIALVPEADGIDASELARVSAALQKQVTRDLAPAWGITATVDAFPYLEDVPVGYWPIIVSLGDLGSQAGVHIDRNGQPYALVRVATGWSLSASRACLEMLINPFENRSVTAPSIRSDQAPVEFLVEVCGPCEDPRHAYTVNGVIVSDFCLPAFFGSKTPQTDRYSWSGSITRPFELPKGGHITWYDPVANNWWLRSHWGENAVDTKIGAVDRKLFSVRELGQACAPLRNLPDAGSHAAFEGLAAQARRASQVRAHRLRSLLGEQLDADLDAAVNALVLPKSRQSVTEATFEEEPEIEIELELDIEEEEAFDFDPDEPTLVAAKPTWVVKSDHSVSAAKPAKPAKPAQAERTTAARNASSTSWPTQMRPPAHVPTLPGPPSLSSLAPVSIDSTREPVTTLRTNQVVGAALAIAAAVALTWGVRTASQPQAPSATATSQAAPVVPPPAQVPAVGTAQQLTAAAAPSTPVIIPGSNAPPNAAPNVAAPTAVAPSAATPSVPAAPVAAQVPATTPSSSAAQAQRPAVRSTQRRSAPRIALPAPAEPVRMRPAADALDDLIDTRR